MPLGGLLALSAIGAGCFTPPDSLPPPTQVSVESVNDGDSFHASGPVEVRLLGINAPELDECGGEEAARHLESLIGGGSVSLQGPGEADQFGRLLAVVWRESTDINAAMVEAGWAIATSDGDYLEAETAARDAGRGLWAEMACGADQPLTKLQIIDLDFDPPGSDEAEAVTIGNPHPFAVDLEGYVLRDESSVNRFGFPAFTLEGDDEVTVVTGCGDDRPGLLHWCADQPVWNNSGDAALILDRDGRVVAFYRYLP